VDGTPPGCRLRASLQAQQAESPAVKPDQLNATAAGPAAGEIRHRGEVIRAAKIEPE
jgi:hypothetical protein